MVAESPATNPDSADGALVRALLAGDAATVGTVRTWIRLAATPYRDLWRNDLDDLGQQALLELFDALRAGRYRGEGTLRGYVRRLVHHHCIDRLRQARRRPTIDIEALDLPSAEPAATERLLNADDVRIGLAVQARAPAACRELWRLIVAGSSYDEMAAALGVAAGTLRVRVLRCRRRALELRDSLLRGGNAAAPTSTASAGEDDD